MDIQIKFINSSNEQDNSRVIVFQKNVATSFDETAVAWQVIKNCGIGENHPFVVPAEMTVKAYDSDGNSSPAVAAEDGQLYDYSESTSGNCLSRAGAGTSTTEVQVRNSLMTAAMNVSIFKDGKLLAAKASIAPEQRAVFHFRPTIWIGAVSEVVQGAVMDSAILSDVNTELSLRGMASADLVMRGGGPGASSTPITFTLENIVMA